MKKIVILDAFSTMHVGNGALLDNSLKACLKAYPDAEINILTLDVKTNKPKYKNLNKTLFGNFATKQPKIKKVLWGIQQLLFMASQSINVMTFKINPSIFTFNQDQRNAMKVINDSDICISITGEGLNDAVYRALYFWLFSYWLVTKLGKKLVIFPQSIGPLEKSINKKLVYHSLKNANLLVGRDKKSYQKLIELGFDKDKIMYSPDVAILQDINEEYKIDQYFNEPNQKKVIGITISKIPPEMNLDVDYVEYIIAAVKNSLDTNEYKILLMPSNYYPDSESPDYTICKYVQKELNDTFETSILSMDPLFPDDYKSLLCQLELFITTRMHVGILSTSGYIPTIAINTQHKIRGYMKNIHMEDYCVELSNLDILEDTIKKALENRESIEQSLRINLENLHKELNIFIERFGAI